MKEGVAETEGEGEEDGVVVGIVLSVDDVDDGD